MKPLAIQLLRTPSWTVWFTRRIGSNYKPKSPYASATQPRPQSPAHRTEEMGHAAPQCRPLDPLSSIAKSFCRYRGRLPFGLPRER